MTNILTVSVYDNGGAMQQLTNAINKYTEHNCRHLNLKQTYLDYETDIKAADYTKAELKELLNDREFFIFSELVPDEIRGMGIEHKLNRQTTIVRCFGSHTRGNIDAYRYWWTNSFTTFVSGGFDPTIHPYLGFCAYHIPNIYEFSAFPEVHVHRNIRICHAPTNPAIKSTQKVAEVIKQLENDYDIESVIIQGKSWKEALDIKASCHITVDQFLLGTYASSAIESMYLKHAVVSRISPFVRSMHPDLPIVQANEQSLYKVLDALLSDPNRIETIGEEGKMYAKREHEAKTNVIKWDHLIKWVNEGFL